MENDCEIGGERFWGIGCVSKMYCRVVGEFGVGIVWSVYKYGGSRSDLIFCVWFCC